MIFSLQSLTGVKSERFSTVLFGKEMTDLFGSDMRGRLQTYWEARPNTKKDQLYLLLHYMPMVSMEQYIRTIVRQKNLFFDLISTASTGSCSTCSESTLCYCQLNARASVSSQQKSQIEFAMCGYVVLLSSLEVDIFDVWSYRNDPEVK